MNRLIYKEASGDLICRSSNFDKVFPALYAYEETGLTPEEAIRLSEYWKQVPASVKRQVIRICEGEFANSEEAATVNTGKMLLRPGDRVVMNDNYYVGEINRGRVWTVCSEPYDLCGNMVVRLAGRSGVYAVDGLDLVEEQEKAL